MAGMTCRALERARAAGRGGATAALMPPVRTRLTSHDGLCAWRRSAAASTCSASGVCQQQDRCLPGCCGILLCCCAGCHAGLDLGWLFETRLPFYMCLATLL